MEKIRNTQKVNKNETDVYLHINIVSIGWKHRNKMNTTWINDYKEKIEGNYQIIDQKVKIVDDITLLMT